MTPFFITFSLATPHLHRYSSVHTMNSSKSEKGDATANPYTSDLTLSPDLLDHYVSYGVDNIEAFLNKAQTKNDLHTVSRFIRLNPRFDALETLNILKSELPQGQPKEISWLSRQLAFYSIPASFSIHKSKCFNSGRIYGMDVSSGAAVAALLLDEYDCESRKERIDGTYRVIDLCCAPGLKLCAIADMLESMNPNGSTSLIGIDICPQRMSLCKNILTKYHINGDTRGHLRNTANSTGKRVHVKLFCTDAKTLGDPSISLRPSSLVFDSQIAYEQSHHAGKRKRNNKSARKRERQRLYQVFMSEMPLNNSKVSLSSPDYEEEATLSTWLNSFDRVLIDAECSSDGALHHIMGHMHHNQYMYHNEKLTDPQKLKQLVELQKNLIMSGFRLLRPGGRLVYSTCSLSSAQNEQVVSWLISSCPSAYIIPLSFDLADKNMVQEGKIKGTVRFRPSIQEDSSDEYGGGFFIAKIGKVCGEIEQDPNE